MTFEQFENAKSKELRAESKACFDHAMDAGGGGAWELRAAKLLEAQFYMSELDRRHDGNIARRDFRMELVVIALIGLELVAASVGMLIGVRESNEQAKLLQKQTTAIENVEKAARNTANMILLLQNPR